MLREANVPHHTHVDISEVNWNDLEAADKEMFKMFKMV